MKESAFLGVADGIWSGKGGGEGAISFTGYNALKGVGGNMNTRRAKILRLTNKGRAIEARQSMGDSEK